VVCGAWVEFFSREGFLEIGSCGGWGCVLCGGAGGGGGGGGGLRWLILTTESLRNYLPT